MRQFVGLAVSLAWAVAWRPDGLLVAQAGADATSTLLPLLAGSPFGVCLVLVLIGWLSPKSTVDRLVEALADVRKQRDDLAAQQLEVIPVLVSVQQTMIPTVDRSERALVAVTKEIVDLRAEVRRLTEKLS